MLLSSPVVPPEPKHKGAFPNKFSARPYFSTNNPYWQQTMPFLLLEVQPRPSMIDFLQAAFWEANRPWDVFGAHLVRQACIRTVNMQIKMKMIPINKESNNKHEKAA